MSPLQLSLLLRVFLTLLLQRSLLLLPLLLCRLPTLFLLQLF